MTRVSASRECVRCGTWATTVMLPTGPICYRCRRNITYPSASNHGILVCAGCAGAESVFACVGCGREDNPYGRDRCARCILIERLTSLLTDPGTGRIHTELVPLYNELVTASTKRHHLAAKAARYRRQAARSHGPG